LEQVWLYWTHTTQVIVITGDNKLTGEAICREIGVFAHNEPLEGKSMTGRSFVDLPASERQRVLRVLSPPPTPVRRHSRVSSLSTTLCFHWRASEPPPPPCCQAI